MVQKEMYVPILHVLVQRYRAEEAEARRAAASCLGSWLAAAASPRSLLNVSIF